ncbi:MAG: M42 family metallopeptidase [Candidatus Delongbacteria bacterium]|jgi:putative aminopeptidase FrvX|nr:M42 family metallopeptidase [Candidatus Delongbacteria bacterium]
MDTLNFELLKKISEASGISGFETKVRNLIRSEIQGLVDDISIDNMGNLTAFRKGDENKKLMIAAHMDEIGFIVTHLEDNGFLRFTSIGGFDPKTLTSQRVVVHGKKDVIGVMGSKPIHVMDDEEKKKNPKIKDYFIDTGMSKEALEKLVEPGNAVTRERNCIQMGDCYNGKSLDNRVSVFVLIETLRALKEKQLPYDLYAVFTVQEEVGLRGAHVASLQIEPDFGIGLDTTIAYDVPGAQPHEMVTRLGEGTAIKLMDSSAIADQRMISFMKETAKRNKIKFQTEILAAGGTDTAFIQRMNKSGAIAGAVSIPTRHIHQVVESVHKKDVKASIDLLSACILEMHRGNWKY